MSICLTGKMILNWDGDIDLNSLLGEYTSNEIKLTDDDELAKKKQRTKTEKSKKQLPSVEHTRVQNVKIRMRFTIRTILAVLFY